MEKDKKKNILKFMVIGLMLIMALLIPEEVFAVNNTKNQNIVNELVDVEDSGEVEEAIKGFILTVGSEGMNKDRLIEAISIYNQITPKYSNKDIVKVIEDNSKYFIESGINEDDLSSVTTVLKNVNTNQLKKILSKIDIEKVAKEAQNGGSTADVLKSITSEFSTSEKVDLVLGTIFSTKIVKNISIFLMILFIYRTLLRCVIYKKANKKAWAAFVPIYRNITMLKICKMSPWWLLLLLVPIIGWIILWIVSVASKFMLSEAFGKGTFFALGLWLLGPIFETILVFNKNIKYIGFEEEMEN